MKSFSLSSLDALPESVCEGGEEYAVNTDFRVILRIFRMLGDPEISEEDKPWLLRGMFYIGRKPAKGDKGFAWFVGCGREKGEAGGERDFDYEQDAAEIYSAFRQVYGIDLMDVEKLHWWRFLPLLEGLFCCDNALSNKVRLRHADDSKEKHKAALERQKRAVKLRENISRTEATLEEELRERLKKGLPIGDLIGR